MLTNILIAILVVYGLDLSNWFYLAVAIVALFDYRSYNTLFNNQKTIFNKIK